jgi:hypothetical protein
VSTLLFNDLFGTMKFKSDIEKKKFEALFQEYMQQLPDSLYKNQFELSKDIPGSEYEDWVRILTHPSFDSWKSHQIAIIATASTDKALAGGNIDDKNAVTLLKVRQDVLNSEKKAEKPTIIVIPESLFFKGEED